MYKKVNPKNNFVGMEKEILEFWRKENIIKKSFDKNQNGEYFTFYDGPPTANGKPHIGHIVTRVIKDLIPRYKVMKGYKVIRKAGWDTHGLPVELEIEKTLGISGKPQIEEYGIEKFVKKCKESIFTYANLWRDMSDRVGYWVDMDNPYVTYDNNYIESVWWSLKQIWDKELLYKGFKIVPYCPRCGTTLSSHEVAQGYKDVEDMSAYVKFKVKQEENLYIMAWTTTPWTLPSNAALAVNKEYKYVKVLNNGENVILAEALLSKLEGEYTILESFKGQELLNLEYEPIFNFDKPSKKAYYVVHGDFVTLNDGTGIVHIAPAYGEDDNKLGVKYDLPLINLVDSEGKFKEIVEPWKGIFVKTANSSIIDNLKERNILYKAEEFEHSYPFCWRCDTPLLYYPRNSWFIKMTSVKDKLVENNNKINWYPDNIKTGRFGNFIENVIDWGISRERYWGTPLPIWECQCGHRECIGSIEELKQKGQDVPDGIELHKPYIDDVKLKCSECGKQMTRVKDVIDCWYDSGSMPFAQLHYPFENKKLFEENFPAQFISEAVDQTRGWFYTLLAISTILFDKNPFENCIVLGHVLDKDGLKMSKHKGNVLSPDVVLNNEGADAARWYFYTSSAPWLPSRFYEEAVMETQRGFLSTLWNVYSFYVLYADIDNFEPSKYENYKSDNVMDKWIISKLNTLVKEVQENLEKYKITQAAKAIEEFCDELSNWYIRCNRTRYWVVEMTDDKINAYMTLYNVLKTLITIAAPFVPFMTEEIYQNITKQFFNDAPDSIHLCAWPKDDESLMDARLEEEMETVYKVVKLGRNVRNSVNIKNRQPLLKMYSNIKSLPEYFRHIIQDELNVKQVILGVDVSEYINYEVKPNLQVMGRLYGKYIPKIKLVLASMDMNLIAKSILQGKKIEIGVCDNKIELNNENTKVSMKPKEGYAFAGDEKVGVVLDVFIDDELREEGYMREIISKIQSARKGNEFDVTDKIKLYVSGNKLLENVISKFEDYIKKETLAVEVVYGEEMEYETFNINGLQLNMQVVKF